MMYTTMTRAKLKRMKLSPAVKTLSRHRASAAYVHHSRAEISRCGLLVYMRSPCSAALRAREYQR